jgi:mannose-6-phosphate isomerase-like protein (cupin superfamily)
MSSVRVRAVVKQRQDVVPAECPCGLSQRIITKADQSPVSVHAVSIKRDSELHYHKHMTEIYYVIKGHGTVQLDSETVAVTEGSTILIPPGVKHRARGDLEIINVVYPPFDPADEYIVE